MASFSRAQSERFAAQGASLRREVLSVSFRWGGKTWCGVFSGLTTRREIEAGGFELQPDATLRVQISLFPKFLPALGDSLVVDNQTFMVTEILKPLAGSDELRVGLGKA